MLTYTSIRAETRFNAAAAHSQCRCWVINCRAAWPEARQLYPP